MNFSKVYRAEVECEGIIEVEPAPCECVDLTITSEGNGDTYLTLTPPEVHNLIAMLQQAVTETTAEPA
jgi:hypothetical protein